MKTAKLIRGLGSSFFQGPYRSGLSALSALLCLAFLLPATAQTSPGELDTQPIRIGFTRDIFKNRNETDTLAAMKVWAMTLAEERGVRVDPDMRVYPSASEAEAALQGNRVDAVTLMLDEYSAFPQGLVTGPYFRHEVAGGTHEEFVLVARKDHGIDSLADLRGASLAIHDGESSNLASAWLEAGLLRARLPEAGELCSRVAYESKLSGAVLGVFFGKNDLALVSRRGFLAMAELNPQVASQLIIVSAAPPIVPSFFCFRARLDSARKQRFLTEVMRLHESITGAQVLRIFKSDRMAQVSDEELRRSVALLRGWTTAADAAYGAPADGESGR